MLSYASNKVCHILPSRILQMLVSVWLVSWLFPWQPRSCLQSHCTHQTPWIWKTETKGAHCHEHFIIQIEVNLWGDTDKFSLIF